MDINRAESAPDLTVDDRTKAGFAKWFRALEEKDRQQGVRPSSLPSHQQHAVMRRLDAD